MEKKIKLLFVFDMPPEFVPFWRDGLWAALQILSSEWEIDYFNIKEGKEFPGLGKYDFILAWTALISGWLGKIVEVKRKGLCFAGGPITGRGRLFNVVFVENQFDLNEFKEIGVNAVKAFGINTQIMRPVQQPKIFDFIYPAAFASWKRHGLFAEKTRGFTALAVGYIQPNGIDKECYEVCQKGGVMIMPQVSYEAMPYLYSASKKCLTTANFYGGGQRAVLEAIACGISVEVEKDALKLQEFKNLTREEILEKWSEKNYAQELKEGIEGVL